jgi:hypothetical protein
MASLAGVWNGWVRLPTGQQVPATFDLKPAGDYVVQGGAFITRGKAQLKDGGLLLVSSDATGVLAIGERTSTAQLGERAGNWVLTGAGRGDAGPFNFEVSRPK